MLGVSTYEYIVRSINSEEIPWRCISNCRLGNFTTNVFSKRMKEYTPSQQQRLKESNRTIEHKPDFPNLITNIISTEIDKAKKILTIDKNRIHPAINQSY